jgi:hypothetical protein
MQILKMVLNFVNNKIGNFIWVRYKYLECKVYL